MACTLLRTCDAPYSSEVLFRMLLKLAADDGVVIKTDEAGTPESCSFIDCENPAGIETLIGLVAAEEGLKVFTRAGDATARITCDDQPSLATLIREVIAFDGTCYGVNITTSVPVDANECETDSLQGKIRSSFVKVGDCTAILVNQAEATETDYVTCDVPRTTLGLVSSLLAPFTGLSNVYAWRVSSVGGEAPASLCYHYEDVDLGQFDLVTNLVIDKVTIDGVDTVINKTVIFGDWGYDYLSFNYAQVVSDLAGFSTTAGIIGMGFFIALTDGGNLGFRFAMVADGAISHTLTYSVDTGSGLTPVTVDLSGQNCGLSYGCYEASYTPEAPFLIDYGNVQAVAYEGLTLFETIYLGPFCTEFEEGAVWVAAFQSYIQTLHGTQSSAALAINGNTATITILNTLLVPLHMDNQGDSGCMAPQSLPQVNNFTLITCP